jgi:hypothetical protein
MSHPSRLFLPALGLCLALLPCSASALDLPANIPARSEGLWQIDRQGTFRDASTTINVQKVWTICLDAKADRALHEFEVRENQASAAMRKESCGKPIFTLVEDTLSSTMRCSGLSGATGKIGSSEFTRFTTFVSADEVRSETMIANRNNAAESDGRFTTHMTRLGACDGSLKPGGMMLMHWRVNGEETLKAREIQNVYREISDFRAQTAAQLDEQR